jgi:hypothetical protein
MPGWAECPFDFKARESGITMGESLTRKRDAKHLELLASLFADYFELLFNSRDDLITSFNQIFDHLRMFGLQIHIGRGATASKTEAMYYPPPRRAFAAAGTSRFLVGGTGFVDLRANFKYLSPVIHYSHLGSRRLQAHQIGYSSVRSFFEKLLC